MPQSHSQEIYDSQCYLQKEKAWKLFREDYIKCTGENIPLEKLKKQLNNMKTELKKKTDKTATGNKKIKLKEWEKELLKLQDPDDNPVFNKVPGT